MTLNEIILLKGNTNLTQRSVFSFLCPSSIYLRINLKMGDWQVCNKNKRIGFNGSYILFCISFDFRSLSYYMKFNKLKPYTDPTAKIIVHMAKLIVIHPTTRNLELPNVSAIIAAMSVPIIIGANTTRPGIPYFSQISRERFFFLCWIV